MSRAEVQAARIESEAAEVRRRWEAGETMTTICRALDLNMRTGSNRLRQSYLIEQGYKVRLRGRRRSTPEEAEARARRKLIQDRHSKRRRRARDGAIRRADERAARDREIRRLWEDGSTGPELSERFGLDVTWIAHIVRGLGRPMRLTPRPQRVWPYPRREYRPVRLAAAAFPPRVEDVADLLYGLGRARQGEGHGRSKLSEAMVIEARRLRAEGMSAYSLARRHGVSAGAMRQALEGKTWGHLPGAVPKVGPGARPSKLSEAQVIELRRLRSEGEGVMALAARFAVDRRTISAALDGTNWSHLPGAIRSGPGPAKLSEAQVIELRRLRAEGRSVRSLAARFGVDRRTVDFATEGTTWGHLPGAIPSEKGGRP